MNKKEVKEIFERFSQMQVMVIGDSMVDSYLWGKVERISPEAPVPVISVNKRENRLGGAANVSLNLQALGATPILFTVVGNDEKGKKLKKLLHKKNLSCEYVFTDPNRGTTVKNRIISQGQHMARIDEENTEYINSELEISIMKSVEDVLGIQKIDVIFFIDYDKGVITPNLIKWISQLAAKKRIPTAVDPKLRNFNHYQNISLFKPNFKEFNQGTGQVTKKVDLAILKKTASQFKTNKNIEYVLITLSELGIFIVHRTDGKYFPAVIRDISDVSGAGDTVISVAGLVLALKLQPETMAKMANIAGGLVCEKPGVVPIDKQQLMYELML